MELIKYFNSNKILKITFLTLIGSIIIALSAKVKIPFYPVPMTMQTFTIILIGAIYGWKLGLSTVMLYLIEGALGLPVFAGTPEKGLGLAYMIGPTMGYLIGFIPAVIIIGYFHKKMELKNSSFIKTFLLILLSISFIYLFGAIWLSNFTGWDKVLVLGVYPFLPAEMFKIIILSLVLKFFKFRV